MRARRGFLFILFCVDRGYILTHVTTVDLRLFDMDISHIPMTE